MYPGQVTEKGIYQRCTHCGDSGNPNRAHMLIDHKGRYYCYKCKASGWCSSDDTISAVLSNPKKVSKQAKLAHFMKNAPHSKGLENTRLNNYSPQRTENGFSIFDMRCPKSGNLTGSYFRCLEEKKSHVEGSGFGFLPPLISSPDNPIYVVEGPYDAVWKNSFVVFGSLSPSLAKHIKGHFSVLVPDGDVWIEKNRQLKTSVLQLAKSLGQMCLGIVQLKPEQDPEDLGLDPVVYPQPLRSFYVCSKFYI